MPCHQRLREQLRFLREGRQLILLFYMLAEFFLGQTKPADLLRAVLSDLAVLSGQDLSSQQYSGNEADGALPVVSASPSSSHHTNATPMTSAAVISVARTLGAMKQVLYGTPEAPPDRAAALELAVEILRSDLLEALLLRLATLPFECALIFAARPRRARTMLEPVAVARTQTRSAPPPDTASKSRG